MLHLFCRHLAVLIQETFCTICRQQQQEPRQGQQQCATSPGWEESSSGQKGSSSRRRRSSFLLKSLTKQISHSDSIVELSELLEEWGGTFDAICVAAAFTRVVKLRCYDSAARERVLDRLAGLWDQALGELVDQPGWEVELHQEFLDKLLAMLQLDKVCSSQIDVASGLVALASAATSPSQGSPIMPAGVARGYAQQLLQKLEAKQLQCWDEQAVANAISACGQLGVYDGCL
eukprot:gene2206-2521_t